MANPKRVEAYQTSIDKNPFEGMKINDNTILNQLDGRNPCPKCRKSRKFYCYSCYVPITALEGLLPSVKLPIKIDIIKHQHEIEGKSTAGHAVILAPDDVTIYTYPNIPDYANENVVLIFPSQTAVSVYQLLYDYNSIMQIRNERTNDLQMKSSNKSTLLKNISKKNNSFYLNQVNKLTVSKVIFIDSTWNQSKSIYKDDRLRKIPCVVIQNRISQFWRHQKGSPRWYLATIEAIHQFLIELHIYLWGLHPNYNGIYKCFTEQNLTELPVFYKTDSKSYNGQYDNLLYLFQHMYDLIHKFYDHDNLFAYKRRLT